MIGINRSVWLAACALLAGGCVPSLMVAAGSYDETAPRSAVLDAAGVTEVQVRAGSGSLRVDGRPGLAEIQIDGTACAADREDLDRIELVTSRSGGTLLIEARTREVSNGQLALDIAMPDSLPLGVDDGTGSIEIVGVAAAAVRDGAGSLRVEQVRGDVRVADGSGGIDICGVGGSVVVESDGSGGIDIRDVRRDVLIEQDGSGSIEVSDVGGDFTVRRDGSGGVRHDSVAGRVSVPPY